MKPLYPIIKALQTTQGNIAKQAILDAHKDHELLREYMKAVLDPAINYYITKLPKIESISSKPSELDDGYFITKVLREFSSRKITGKKAVVRLKEMLHFHTKESRELIEYIIKRKIDKSNVGETMVLKTWPGLFFVPPYMRCASMSAKIVEHYRGKRRFYVQPKRDGSFAYVVRGLDGIAKAFTRSGNSYPAWFANELAEGLNSGQVLIGELEVYEHGPMQGTVRRVDLLDRKTGNGVLNSIQQGGEIHDYPKNSFKFVAWDMVSESEFKSGKSDREYFERLGNVEWLVDTGKCPAVELIETHEVESVEEAFAINTTLTTAGKEGTVWKAMDGIWRDTSSGTKDCVKLKVKFQADYKVKGFYEGEGKAAGMLGGITIATEDDLLECNCGSGFSDAERVALWELRNTLPDTIVEIEANDVITNKQRPDVMALSLPIFIELRRDKKVADTLARVIEQRDAARMGL